eukprot:767583-Hanusia_phi.AAC.6
MRSSWIGTFLVFIIFHVRVVSLEKIWKNYGNFNSNKFWSDAANWRNGIPRSNSSVLFNLNGSVTVNIDMNVSVSSLYFVFNVSDKYSIARASVILIISNEFIFKAGSMFVGDRVNLCVRGKQFEILDFGTSENSITWLNVSSIQVGDQRKFLSNDAFLVGDLTICTENAHIYSNLRCNGTISLQCGSLALYSGSSKLYGNLTVHEESELVLPQGASLHSFGRLDVSGVVTLQNYSNLTIDNSLPSKFLMRPSSVLRGGTGLVRFTRIQCLACISSTHVLSGTSFIDIQIVQGNVSVSGRFRQYGSMKYVCSADGSNLIDLRNGQLEMFGNKLELCQTKIRGPPNRQSYQQNQQQKDVVLRQHTKLILDENSILETANLFVQGDLLVQGFINFIGPVYVECQGQVSWILTRTNLLGISSSIYQSAIFISGELSMPANSNARFESVDIFNEGVLMLQGVKLNLDYSAIIQQKSSSIFETDYHTDISCWNIPASDCINIVGGVFEGEGMVSASTVEGFYTIRNNGTIRPGYSNSVGCISIAGAFFQTSSGRIEIGIDAHGSNSYLNFTSQETVKDTIAGALSLKWNPSNSFFLKEKVYPFYFLTSLPNAALMSFQIESNGYGIAATENLVISWPRESGSWFMVYLAGCAIGQQQTPMETCEKCTVGSYGDERGLTFCKDCVQGKYSNSLGSTFCVECLPGYFANTAVSSTCQACTAGKYSNTNATVQCEVCSAGTFQPSPASTFCEFALMQQYDLSDFRNSTGEQCPPGKISSFEGAAICVGCKAGKYEVNGIGCNDCMSGTYSLQSASTCLYCSPGSIAPLDGSSTCVSCEPGSFSNGSRPGHMATDCIQCQIGKYAPTTASSICYDCPENQIAPTQGLSVCLACPEGKVKSPTMELCMNTSSNDSWHNHSTNQNLSITNHSFNDSIMSENVVSISRISIETTPVQISSNTSGFPIFLLYAGLSGLLAMLAICAFSATKRCKTTENECTKGEIDLFMPSPFIEHGGVERDQLPAGNSHEESSCYKLHIRDDSIADEVSMFDKAVPTSFLENVDLFQFTSYAEPEETAKDQVGSQFPLDVPAPDPSTGEESSSSDLGYEGKDRNTSENHDASDASNDSRVSWEQASMASSHATSDNDWDQNLQEVNADSSDEAPDSIMEADSNLNEAFFSFRQTLPININQDFNELEQSTESMNRFKYLIRGSVPRYALQARDETGAAQTAEFSLASTSVKAKGVGRLL